MFWLYFVFYDFEFIYETIEFCMFYVLIIYLPQSLCFRAVARNWPSVWMPRMCYLVSNLFTLVSCLFVCDVGQKYLFVEWPFVWLAVMSPFATLIVPSLTTFFLLCAVTLLLLLHLESCGIPYCSLPLLFHLCSPIIIMSVASSKPRRCAT